jgi:ABC-type multidrug transport system fused ATPase/permease subunit
LPQKFLLYDEVATAKEMMTTVTVGGEHRPLETGNEIEMAKSSEVEMNTCTPEDNTDVNDTVDRKGIKITNVTARWTEDLPENTLTDVSLDVRPGELVAVVGPVGSGKVSCSCIVGKEME